MRDALGITEHMSSLVRAKAASDNVTSLDAVDLSLQLQIAHHVLVWVMEGAALNPREYCCVGHAKELISLIEETSDDSDSD